MKKFDYNTIDKQMRFRGKIINIFLGKYTIRKMHMRNKLTTLLFKGHSFTRKLVYKQIFIDREDGSKLRVCIYKPKNQKQTACAGVLWIHGGGYAMGEPEQDIGFIKEIVSLGCVVVAPAYTKSTQKPFPAALDDCYLALKWMNDNSDNLAYNSDKLFIGGESAGGGLTVATTLLARDKGEVNIAFQMPFYPMLDCGLTKSSTDNMAPVWNTKSNRLAWMLYLNNVHYDPKLQSKYASPANEVDYSKLPPALTYVGNIEPFKDETENYVNKLKDEGIDVKFSVFEGCFHGFDVVASGADKSKQAKQFWVDGLKYAINNYSSPQKNKISSK